MERVCNRREFEFRSGGIAEHRGSSRKRGFFAQEPREGAEF